ncbi:MAG: hypothetical protein KME11_10125 [Timaviella obliquedivisa GSE-PSE-MK23-08B]|jgi:hypothetical protein|nr:hypothetical protein [Timaviella obliquedivisa GSE-PSE-MK23-08B]
MLSQVFYLIRSKADGQYLVARTKAEPKQDNDRTGDTKPADARAVDAKYLLVFKEHYDALSYINTHGADVADRFAVESIAGTQLGNLLKRWGFMGMGMVQDPLLPRIEFLQHE